jgi:predicted homoserine dehydrogenase-like protein
MKAGEIINCADNTSMKALLMPSSALKENAPLHSYICHSMKLKRDIPAGTLITYDMVDIPSDSILLKLRRESDKHFGLK